MRVEQTQANRSVGGGGVSVLCVCVRLNRSRRKWRCDEHFGSAAAADVAAGRQVRGGGEKKNQCGNISNRPANVCVCTKKKLSPKLTHSRQDTNTIRACVRMRIHTYAVI